MNKISLLVFAFIYSILLSEVSLSLGLTSRVIESPTLNSDGDVSGIVGMYEVLANNIGSFFQLATLSADIPSLLSLFFISPVIIAVIIVIVLILRGV